MKKFLISLLFLLSVSVFAQPIVRGTISGGWYILENKTKGKILWVSDSLIVNALIRSTTDSVIILDNLSVRGKIRANQYLGITPADSSWRTGQFDTLYGFSTGKTGRIRFGAKKVIGDTAQFNTYVGINADTSRFLNSKTLLGGKNIDSLIFGPNSKVYRAASGKKIVANSDTFSIKYLVCDSTFARSLRASKIYNDTLIFNALTKLYAKGDTVIIETLRTVLAKSAKTTIDSLFLTYLKSPDPITPTIMVESMMRFGQNVAMDSIISLHWTVVVRDSFKVLGSLRVGKKLYVDTVYCNSGDTLFIKSNTKFLKNVFIDSTFTVSKAAKFDSLRAYTSAGVITIRARTTFDSLATFNTRIAVDTIMSMSVNPRMTLKDSIIAKVKLHMDSSFYALSGQLRDSLMCDFYRSLNGNMQVGSPCSVFVFGQVYVLPNLDTTTVLGSRNSRWNKVVFGPNGWEMFGNADSARMRMMALDTCSFSWAKIWKWTGTTGKQLMDTVNVTKLTGAGLYQTITLLCPGANLPDSSVMKKNPMGVSRDSLGIGNSKFAWVCNADTVGWIGNFDFIIQHNVNTTALLDSVIFEVYGYKMATADSDSVPSFSFVFFDTSSGAANLWPTVADTVAMDSMIVTKIAGVATLLKKNIMFTKKASCTTLGWTANRMVSGFFANRPNKSNYRADFNFDIWMIRIRIPLW